jgi:hypothetical protein
MPSRVGSWIRARAAAALVAELDIPVLALSGEGESEEQRRQAEEAYAALRGPERLRIFTAAEGAEAHTQVNHPALMQETVFGWLAETFGPRDGQRRLARAAASDDGRSGVPAGTVDGGNPGLLPLHGAARSSRLAGAWAAAGPRGRAADLA